jgi:hypothetical protein
LFQFVHQSFYLIRDIISKILGSFYSQKRIFLKLKVMTQTRIRIAEECLRHSTTGATQLTPLDWGHTAYTHSGPHTGLLGEIPAQHRFPPTELAQ